MRRPTVAFGPRRIPVHLGTTHRTSRYSLLPAVPLWAWTGYQLVQAAQRLSTISFQAYRKPMSPRTFPATLPFIQHPLRARESAPNKLAIYLGRMLTAFQTQMLLQDVPSIKGRRILLRIRSISQRTKWPERTLDIAVVLAAKHSYPTTILRIRRAQRGGNYPSAQRMALLPGLTKPSLKKKASQMPKLLPRIFLEQHHTLPRQLPHLVAQMHELFRRTLRSAQLTARRCGRRCHTLRKSGHRTLPCNRRLPLAEGAARFPLPPPTATRRGRVSMSMAPAMSSQPTIARQ